MRRNASSVRERRKGINNSGEGLLGSRKQLKLSVMLLSIVSVCCELPTLELGGMM